MEAVEKALANTFGLKLQENTDEIQDEEEA